MIEKYPEVMRIETRLVLLRPRLHHLHPLMRVVAAADVSVAADAVPAHAPSPLLLLLVSSMTTPLEIAAVETEIVVVVVDCIGVDVAVALGMDADADARRACCNYYCASTLTRPQRWVASMPQQDQRVHLLLLLLLLLLLPPSTHLKNY